MVVALPVMTGLFGVRDFWNFKIQEISKSPYYPQNPPCTPQLGHSPQRAPARHSHTPRHNTPFGNDDKEAGVRWKRCEDSSNHYQHAAKITSHKVIITVAAKEMVVLVTEGVVATRPLLITSVYHTSTTSTVSPPQHSYRNDRNTTGFAWADMSLRFYIVAELCGEDTSAAHTITQFLYLTFSANHTEYAMDP